METVVAETLVMNLASLRRVVLNGREYLVAPATLIVPGVLNGSSGPILYTAEETVKNVQAWNGMPITNGHPYGPDGKPISARSPGVLNSSVMGFLFDTIAVNGKLLGNLYFDVLLVRNVAPGLLPLLTRGIKVELSTGLNLDLEKAVDNAVHNGTSYTHVARNYRPDHVAILLNSTGACGIKHGCGVFNADGTLEWVDVTAIPPDSIIRNNDPASGEGSMNREQTIAYLTTNCDCWKGKVDTLNRLSDDDLKALHAAAVVNVQNKQQIAERDAQLVIVRNTLGVDSLPVGNALADALKAKMTPTTPAIIPAPAPSPEAPKRATLTELLANATPEEQGVWNMAQQIVRDKKASLVEMIVNARGKTDQAKAELRSHYIGNRPDGRSKFSIEDLEMEVKYLPASSTGGVVGNFHVPDPGYRPAAPAVLVNQDDLLLPPTFTE